MEAREEEGAPVKILRPEGLPLWIPHNNERSQARVEGRRIKKEQDMNGVLPKHATPGVKAACRVEKIYDHSNLKVSKKLGIFFAKCVKCVYKAYSFTLSI